MVFVCQYLLMLREVLHAIFGLLVHLLSALEPRPLVTVLQCAQLELFTHFLNAVTEGGKIPIHL